MGEAELKAELAKLDRRYRGQRYPKALRARAVHWAQARREEGVSWRRVAESLGLRTETIRRWCVTRAAQRSPTGLVPVEVIASDRVAVVSPSGWRVEGLSVEAAARLVRSLA